MSYDARKVKTILRKITDLSVQITECSEEEREELIMHLHDYVESLKVANTDLFLLYAAAINNYIAAQAIQLIAPTETMH